MQVMWGLYRNCREVRGGVTHPPEAPWGGGGGGVREGPLGGGGVLEGEEGGVWDVKDCVPKMAQSDFPDGKFRFFPRRSFWSGGGGPGGAGGSPLLLLQRIAILILPFGGGGGGGLRILEPAELPPGRETVWKLSESGSCVGAAWGLLESCWEVVCKLYRGCMGAAWEWYGRCMGGVPRPPPLRKHGRGPNKSRQNSSSTPDPC